MKLITNFRDEFTRLLGEVSREVLLVSPFVTSAGGSLIRKLKARRPDIRCRLVTRLNPADFWSEVSELPELILLSEAGVEIKSLKGLHAKAYVFDNRAAIVTSSNLTKGGLQNNHEWGVSLSEQRREKGTLYLSGNVECPLL